MYIFAALTQANMTLLPPVKYVFELATQGASAKCRWHRSRLREGWWSLILRKNDWGRRAIWQCRTFLALLLFAAYNDGGCNTGMLEREEHRSIIGKHHTFPTSFCQKMPTMPKKVSSQPELMLLKQLRSGDFIVDTFCC